MNKDIVDLITWVCLGWTFLMLIIIVVFTIKIKKNKKNENKRINKNITRS